MVAVGRQATDNLLRDPEVKVYPPLHRTPPAPGHPPRDSHDPRRTSSRTILNPTRKGMSGTPSLGSDTRPSSPTLTSGPPAPSSPSDGLLHGPRPTSTHPHDFLLDHPYPWRTGPHSTENEVSAVISVKG